MVRVFLHGLGISPIPWPGYKVLRDPRGEAAELDEAAAAAGKAPGADRSRDSHVEAGCVWGERNGGSPGRCEGPFENPVRRWVRLREKASGLSRRTLLPSASARASFAPGAAVCGAPAATANPRAKARTAEAAPGAESLGQMPEISLFLPSCGRARLWRECRG